MAKSLGISDAVRKHLAKHPDASRADVLSALGGRFKSSGVNAAYYSVKAKMNGGGDVPALANDSPLENLVGKLPAISLTVGDVPFDVGIANGKPLGTLRITKDGISFRKPHTKPTGKVIRWEAVPVVVDLLTPYSS